ARLRTVGSRPLVSFGPTHVRGLAGSSHRPPPNINTPELGQDPPSRELTRLTVCARGRTFLRPDTSVWHKANEPSEMMSLGADRNRHRQFGSCCGPVVNESPKRFRSLPRRPGLRMIPRVVGILARHRPKGLQNLQTICKLRSVDDVRDGCKSL